MRLLLIRHAHAGSRRAWTGDDEQRELSPRGQKQAAALSRLLRDESVELVVSSPFRRCIQTVEPLAKARRLDVAVEPELAEGAALRSVLAWLRTMEEVSVAACSHGDVIGALITALRPDDGDPPRWPKASTWVLEGDPRHPNVRFLPPPS